MNSFSMKVLVCVVVEDGSIFGVDIEEHKKVGILKDIIKDKNGYSFPAKDLTLYLAKKGDNWFKTDDSDMTMLKDGKVSEAIHGIMNCKEKIMDPSYRVRNTAFGFPDEDAAEDGEIHVLVGLPPSASRQQTALWLVRGSIADALSTKGVRCRLYRLAGTYLGYYDPARRTGGKNVALWYEDKTLCVHILFETKENALHFDNALQEEPVTLGSPLHGQKVTTSVAQVEVVSTELKRIYFVHYDPQESELPQDTTSSISLTSSVSILDATRDEFRYQRIEHEGLFLPYGNAESCHFVSKKQSRDHKREFAKYDRDPNNRLALSRDMHGWFDGMSCEVPIVNMLAGSVEERPSIGSRYKVEVFVKVLDAQCTNRVFSRLKAKSTKTDDSLMMKTFVHVENPETFCFCMKWKHDETDELWRSFLDMTPAVD